MKVFVVIASILAFFANGASGEMTRSRNLQESFAGFDDIVVERNNNGSKGSCGDCCKLVELSTTLISNAIAACGAAASGPDREFAGSQCDKYLCTAAQAIFVNYEFSGGACDIYQNGFSPALVGFLCGLSNCRAVSALNLCF